MKKIINLTLFVAALSILASCRKGAVDPIPSATPVTNQPSATAPYLQAGSNTSLTVNTGGANSQTMDMTDVVVDPQGDEWSITSVSSSNSRIVTVAISTSDNKAFVYTGVYAGTATLSITIADADGNTNVIAYSVVAAVPNTAPTLNNGINTSFQIAEGSSFDWDLSDKITDVDGDAWTITSATSGITAIATSTLTGSKEVRMNGVSTGRVFITLIASDEHGNTHTITATVSVYTSEIVAVEAVQLP